jgi:hypothetical protein
LRSVDPAPQNVWPLLKKCGLAATTIGGGTTIADGFNRKENHSGIEERFRLSVNNAHAVVEMVLANLCDV